MGADVANQPKNNSIKKVIAAMKDNKIIHCKDCKYYKESKKLFPNKFCYRLLDNKGKPIGYNFSPNDFCSRGERK